MVKATRRVMSAMVVVALLPGACSTKPEDEIDESACALTSCPDGYVLQGQSCVVACGECPAGQECIQGTCLPPGAPLLGGFCASAADCPPGAECTDLYISTHGVVLTSYGNHCTWACHDGCPDGTVCYSGLCHRPCNPLVADSCGDPMMRCYAPSDLDTGICFQSCAQMSDLGFTYYCDTIFENTCDMATGVCVDQLETPCTPGETTCHEDSVLRCSADHMSLVCEERCGGNRTCSDGRCIDCASHDHLGCAGDDVYWYDSCDNREDLYESCPAGESCIDGGCGDCTRICTCNCSCVTFTIYASEGCLDSCDVECAEGCADECGD